MTDTTMNNDEFTLADKLEGLLFVASGPVTALQLAQTLELTVDQVESSLNELKQRLSGRGGIYLQVHKNKFQLTSKPGLGSLIERFLGLQATSRLSRAGIETLAIIAYKQPVTRPQLDDVRGVNSDGVIRSLLSKGLIEENGRAEGPGRPIIYGTTNEFLQYFGLSSLDELPELNLDPQAEINEIQEKVFKD